MKTIRVTGKGQLKVKPDTTRITMTLEGRYPEYSETLRHSSEDTEVLKDVLSRFGFDRSDLKTLNFSVDTEYESYREREAYKQRFVGYRFSHVMKVEFPSDNQRLGRILYALANCNVSPEFRISYTVKDPEAAKNALLGKAVVDAKEKASVLAAAAGRSLGPVRSITEGWQDTTYEANMKTMAAMDAGKGAGPESSAADFMPGEAEITANVTVTYELK